MWEPAGREETKTTRRHLLGAIAGGIVGGMAGCVGENEITSSSSVLGHSFPRLPEATQLNPWTTGYPSTDFTPVIFEYLAVRTPGEGYRTADLLDSVTIDGTTVTVEFADGYTWWNGEPVTARDRWVSERITALRPDSDRQNVVESVSVEDDLTLQYELAQPLARPLVFSELLEEPLNTAAWVFEPWVQRFEDAASSTARQEVADELLSTTIELEEAADEGFGCGPYKFEEISPNRLMLELYEDHPRAPDLSIPRLWFPVEHGSRINQLIKRGWLDLGRGSLEQRGVSIPNNLEQLDRSPTTNGWKIALNWSNDHLARRPVRRALLCALPIPTIVRAAGWGSPVNMQTGLSSPAEDRWFDDDLRDSFIRYPMEADPELAENYMQNAGYTRGRGNRWFSPNGVRVALKLVVPVMWASTGNLFEQALTSFGFVVDTDQISNTAYFAVSRQRGYDLLPYPTDGRPHWAYDVTQIDEATLGFGVSDPSTETTSRGKPVSPSIPSDLTNPDETQNLTVNLVEAWERIRSPTSMAETKEAVELFARWWNYDLPDIEMATAQMGVWGNTRDFEWPDPGDRAYRTFGSAHRPEFYLLQTGKIRRFDE